MERRVQVEGFFHGPSNTISYLLWDPATLRGALIDPVLDFDAASGKADTRSVDAVLGRAAEIGLEVEWSLETHVHADHLSGAQRVRDQTGARTVIGAGVKDVQRTFAPMFGFDLAGDGREFDLLVEDGDRLPLGEIEIRAIAVPGHTPADIAYLVGDAVFVGDSLFMPDYGTARCDFPGGSARQLHASVQRLLALPDETRMFVCHDYKAPGREDFAWETTVGAQRANVHLQGGSAEAFVAMRETRDATLSVPAMLLPALQVNICGGRVPDALKIPVTWTTK